MRRSPRQARLPCRREEKGRLRILFRADSSTAIGSGHVVRCATLAQMLSKAGHEVHFVCRKLRGDLNSWLAAQGYGVHRIEPAPEDAEYEANDVAATARSIQGQFYDWLIVDHYGLGARWERAMKSMAGGIFVIDDLGRAHDCDLLLDQNYANPTHALYTGRVPPDCELLLGARFALLQPEFAALRQASLQRNRDCLRRILVCMGASDPVNETSKALFGVSRLPDHELQVDVVIGKPNPHREAVASACARLRHATLYVQTPRMAELMAKADCVIGAAGNISWERCALGVPGLATILADNQHAAAEAVDAAGGHHLLGWHRELIADDYTRALLAMDSVKLRRMSAAAAEICDGSGTQIVAQHLANSGHRVERALGTRHA
jgi:UDP-2,4-diacetamido-2,4,6-trideoxy-beta-L-altropyranose hydrolase